MLEDRSYSTVEDINQSNANARANVNKYRYSGSSQEPGQRNNSNRFSNRTSDQRRALQAMKERDSTVKKSRSQDKDGYKSRSQDQYVDRVPLTL